MGIILFKNSFTRKETSANDVLSTYFLRYTIHTVHETVEGGEETGDFSDEKDPYSDPTFRFANIFPIK